MSGSVARTPGKEAAVDQLPQADRFYDDRDDSPYWNESVWFSFSIPERKIHGLIQYYFRPAMGMLNGGPAMWDPTGTSVWNCLHYNWSHLQPSPPGQQKFDMTALNSLSVKVLEPLKRYAISYDLDGFEMDLEWTAIAPVHELKIGNRDQEMTARFHIEQAGRMRGMVRRHGEAFPIDCFSMRDTSYGVRNYSEMKSGGYFLGIAADSSFHAIVTGDGAEASVVGGYIWKDGTLASIVSGKRRVLDYHPHGPRDVAF